MTVVTYSVTPTHRYFMRKTKREIIGMIEAMTGTLYRGNKVKELLQMPKSELASLAMQTVRSLPLELSEPARLIFGSLFGICKTVVYEMKTSIPSPQMQIILDELVRAGCLIRTKPYDNAVQYDRVENDLWTACRSDYSLGLIKGTIIETVPKT